MINLEAYSLHSAEPATMKPITLTLTPTFLQGGGNAPPLDVVGSDTRLEMQIQPGSFDLSHASTTKGKPVTGPITLKLIQNFGHYAEAVSLLGNYSLQAFDNKGHLITGIRLRTPITLVYHYQQWEMTNLGLDPGHLFLLWPDLLSAARQAHQSLRGLMIPLVENAKAHTLTARSAVFGNGPFDEGGGDPTDQSPAAPHLATSQGNSGQMSLSYPIAMAPGPAGFGPTLALSYSSSDPNQRHSGTSPASVVGDGWSLGLGAITMENYPAGSASSGTWYFLSGVDNISDRLVQSSTDSTGTYFYTEHISRLRIELLNQQYCSHTNRPCFQVTDTSGNIYRFGDTTDSLEYYSDSNGTRHDYQWNLRLVMSPYDGQVTAYNQYLATYLQDSTSNNGYTTIRDSAVKQITYGTWLNNSFTLSGTVDFAYHAPFSDSPWTTAYNYGVNYQCADGKSPPVTTTLRCDDPQNLTNGGITVDAPGTMSTFELDSVTTYVGDDSSSSHKDYSYSFTYNDYPFYQSWDSYTQYEEYMAGEHILTGFTSTAYQNGTSHARKPVSFGYSKLQDTYFDILHTDQKGGQYGVQLSWFYLTSYLDTNTGVGGLITYSTAYNNSHGTPAIKNQQGTIIDDRYDPLYCTLHASDCGSGTHYDHPEDQVWSVQVVTQIAAIGADSSASSRFTETPAITTYAYRLAKTAGSFNNQYPDFCYPDQYGDQDCVGDDYIPATYSGGQDSDWQDFYHAEFRGFNVVYITSPSGDLTQNAYFSTEGWATGSGNSGNFDAGQMYQQDIYSGNSSTGPLLQETKTTYAGNNSTSSPCDGNLNVTYVPCLIVPISTTTSDVEGGSLSAAPWVETDYTYDDYIPNNGQYGLGTGYNNLDTEKITSSNGPPMQKQWTYKTTDNTSYYTVNKVTHSEVDSLNSSGTVTHVWQCKDLVYDEGAAPGTPTPVAGMATTVTTHSDCSNPSQSAITTYAAYDAYGNVVATVDGVGAANSSLYNSNGCTPTTTPVYLSSNWTAGRFTACTAYDSFSAQPTTITNAFGQSSTTTYDQTQEDLPVSVTDTNGQATGTSYSYDSNGNRTISVSQPGEGNTYTTQSDTATNCAIPFPPTPPVLPCFESDSDTQLYSSATASTYYDALGRAVETRTPGPDAAHDTIVFTVYNDQTHSTFTSVPFEVTAGSGWLDPATATDLNGHAPAGTATFYDALGRVVATQDPVFDPPSVPGINCPSLGNTAATTCIFYGIGSAQGDSATYSYSASLDANNHVTVSFANALGWTVYTQQYKGVYSGSGIGGLGSNLVEQQAAQYNTLGLPTSVTATDETTNPVTSVTATASYDDLGRVTQTVDPERGTDTFTYDANGQVLSSVSGSRTIGYNYDLLGRLGCTQDGLPTINASGACTSGTHPYVQNTYDTNELGTKNVDDFPTGRLTQTVATTYYPDSGNPTVTTTEKMQYDARGRLTTQQLALILPSSWNITTPLPTDYQMTLGYNDANQLVTTQTSTNPSGQGYTTTNLYDGTTGVLNGLSNQSNATTPDLAALSFNLNAQVGAVNFQTSSQTALAQEQFTYDGDLRPFDANAQWQSGSGSSGQIFDQTRSYDPASNVISETTTQAQVSGSGGGAETQDFCYDTQNRLVWAGNSGTEPAPGSGTCGTGTLSNTLSGAAYSNAFSYGYLDQYEQAPYNGTGSYQYLYCNSATPHQVTGIYATGSTCASKAGKTYTATYDAWGNVVSRTLGSGSSADTATLSYDLLNQFIEWNDATSGNQSQAWYAYDASGNRVLQRATTGGATTITVYAFGLEEHLYDGSGNLQSSTYYYSLGGRLIGELTASGTSMLLTDPLGSVLVSFSNLAGSAAVQANRVYGPTGTVPYKTGTFGTDKGFTGQYHDPATQLDYYGARYYDAKVGLFLSADSVQGNLQGMNPYAYAGGNPETMNDPTGNWYGPPCYGCGPGHAGGSGGSGGTGGTGGTGGNSGGGSSGSGGSIGSRGASLRLQRCRLEDICPGQVTPPMTRADLLAICAADPVCRHWEFDQGLEETISVFGQLGMFILNLGDGISEVQLDVAITEEEDQTSTELTAEVIAQDQEVANQLEDEGILSKDEAANVCSFTASTLVATSHGEQAIGTLKVGEKVLAYNPKTHKMELEPVLHVWLNHDNDLVDLTLTTTTHAPHSTIVTKTSEVVHTNQKHPFFTLERGFVPVAQLHLGMHVLRADGNVGVVTGWKVVPGTKAMYNLTVAQDHTFTVGVGQWVVHNTAGLSGDCGGTGGDGSGMSRSISDTSDLDTSLPQQLQDDGVIQSGGRSGGSRPLNGNPNSYVQTTGGHALVYDDQGRLIYDIDTNRVKMTVWDQAPNGNFYPRDVKLTGPVPASWLDLLPSQ
ncbi:MAG: RHS repeat-associated core domain-containing protein [Ktedonobacteraceae bacterium]